MADTEGPPTTFPVSWYELPTEPLLAIARLLNKDDRRSLSQCNRRFRNLIWASEDEALDCRLEYKYLEINVNDCDYRENGIKFDIIPKSLRSARQKHSLSIYRDVSIEGLGKVLAEIHQNWNHVDPLSNQSGIAVELLFRASHITLCDFDRTVKVVGGFGVFKKKSPSSKFSEGIPLIRLTFSHTVPLFNIPNRTIADTVLSNSLINSADMCLLPEMYRETIRLCAMRGIDCDMEDAFRKNDHFVAKSLGDDDELFIFFF